MARQFEASNGETVVFDTEGNLVNKDDNPDTEADRAAQDLIDHLGELGDGYSVTVHRIPNGNNNSEELCFRCPADKYDPAGLQVHVQETYGPGDYRIRVWKNGARGARQNKLISIAKPVAQSTTVPVPALTGEVGQLIQAMMAMHQQSTQQMQAMLERLSTRPDPMQEIRGQLVIMREMREAMGIQAPASATPATPVDPITQLVATLGGLMKLKDMATGLGFIPAGGAGPAEGDGLDSIAGVVKTIAPQALQLFKRQQDLKAAEINAAIVTHAGRQPNPAPAATVKLDDGPAPLPEEAKRLLQAIQDYAAQDADPEQVAGTLMAMPNVKPFLDMLANDASPFKTLCGYWPAAMDTPDWWIDLIDIIRERLTAGPAGGENGANSVPPGAGNVQGSTDDAGGHS